MENKAKETVNITKFTKMYTCIKPSSAKGLTFSHFFNQLKVVHLVARITFTFIIKYTFMAENDLGNTK